MGRMAQSNAWRDVDRETLCRWRRSGQAQPIASRDIGERKLWPSPSFVAEAEKVRSEISVQTQRLNFPIRWVGRTSGDISLFEEK